MGDEVSEHQQEILTKIRDRLADLDRLGPRTDDAQLFNSLHRRLFTDGQRAAFVDGQEVVWREGRQLRPSVRAQLLESDEDDGNLISQLTALLASEYSRSQENWTVPIRTSEYARREQNWIPDTHSWFGEPAPTHLAPAQMARNVVSPLVDSATKQARREGRILILDLNGQLVAPSAAAKLDRRRIAFFIFSSEIVGSILAVTKSQPAKRQELKKLIKQILRHFRSQDRYVTKQQLRDIARTYYGFGADAADRAIQDATVESDFKNSNLKKAERVNISEIKEFNISQGVNPSPHHILDDD